MKAAPTSTRRALDGAGADRNLSRIEAPVTAKAYLLCAFAAFGGILFGYDSAYISGVLAMDWFKREFGHAGSTDESAFQGYLYRTWEKSLITSILSAGTFCGALGAGVLGDWVGRRATVILGCGVFGAGVALQVASTGLALLVSGRFVAGVGVGYMSEIAPKAVRGAIVSGYQWAITLGYLLAACVNYNTAGRMDSGSYRIPMAVQLLWPLILGTALFLLPESPRFYVKENRVDDAARSLSRLRGQPVDSEYIQAELAELVASHRQEQSGGGWVDCFRGGWKPSGNFRRVMLGVLLQMWQQLTGINFIFFYGTTFFQQVGISSPFVINIITNAVNFASTPLSLWIIEKCGRRTMLIYGALGMLICEFIVAGVGVMSPNDDDIVLIAMVCLYIFFFATTWGPAAWAIVGEIFPLPIRAKGVAMSTASNWFWNWLLAFITPYIIDEEYGNLGVKVFFIWGSTCTLCGVFAFFMVPETKGLSLEQVDQMLEETTPITSSRWVPHYTFADEATRADVAKATGVTKHTEDTEHTRRLGNGIEFLEFNSIVEGKGE
ncbi:hypothetical protein SLS56_011011 [Neofusicoccum ribis]|uniref:Major facilitator superfamily (MFS) profile domain-containing protein n=1 Tax=Neofusicoccum ribis TaxID=45134 RepID=A0ABR3SCS7_9PEZI